MKQGKLHILTIAWGGWPIQAWGWFEWDVHASLIWTGRKATLMFTVTYKFFLTAPLKPKPALNGPPVRMKLSLKI
jgi:hypothetical protein